MGVLSVSSCDFRTSKCPFSGVRGISEGRGEKGARDEALGGPWFVESGAGTAVGIVFEVVF